MFKKFQPVIVFSLLLSLVFCTTVKAVPDLEKEAALAAKVKTEIERLGTGTEARIKIKLRDNTKLKGYVSEIKDSGFVLINRETGASQEISYLQVKKVKGQNRSSGEKTFVRASIAIGVILLYGFIVSRQSEY